MAMSLSLFGCGSKVSATEKDKLPEGTALVYETERDPFTKEEIQAFLKTQGIELVEEGEKGDARDNTYREVHGICTDGADYTVAQYQGQPHKLCDQEIAVKAAQDEIDGILKINKEVTAKLEKPQLEYGCVKENGSFFLKPMWRVSYSQTLKLEQGDHVTHHQVFVDAVTGENITRQKLR